MKIVFLFLALLLCVGTFQACNTDNEADNSPVTWPDVTVNLTVTGDATQTLNFTNVENGPGDDNINSGYDTQTGELMVFGWGSGAYTWNIKALSAPVPSVGNLTVKSGTYVKDLGTANGAYFGDLVNGTFYLSSASLLDVDMNFSTYKLSGSFEMVLTNNPGTVTVSGSFTNLVLTVAGE